MQKKARRSGFTLPEVLVTVTVVAVLAAVVVPAVTQYVGKGGSPASASDLDQLRNAITGYVADNRSFPGYLDALSATTPAHGEIATSFHGPYLSAAVTATTTSATDMSATAFSTSGLGVSFADSINVTGGYLNLFVATATTCRELLALDTLVDGPAGSSTLGNATGNLTWTGTCAQGTPTGSFTAGTALLRLMPAGT